MSTTIFGLLAIGLYLATALTIALALAHGTPSGTRIKTPTLALGSPAIILHGIVLYQSLLTVTGIDLGVFNAASLVTWLIALLLVLGAMVRPVANLGLVMLPLAAIAIALELAIPSSRILPENAPLGLSLHIALSVLAYSLLSIAAIQAVMLAIADHRLRHKHPVGIMHFLPPLRIMEKMLFQLLTTGLILLSLSLLSGLVFIEDIFAQHLLHKTVLSIFAWLVFLTLILGHYFFGWRGKTAVRYTLGGFVLLMLAYFGTKVVLELILHRI